MTEQLRRTSTGWEVSIRVADDQLETFPLLQGFDESTARRRASRMASLAARLRRSGWSRSSIVRTLATAGTTPHGDWRDFIDAIEDLLDDDGDPAPRATTPPTRSVL